MPLKTKNSDKSENIIVVESFNLLNVDWINGLVGSPVNFISQHFRIQNEYLDLFTTKGLYCFLEDTRCKID